MLLSMFAIKLRQENENVILKGDSTEPLISKKNMVDLFERNISSKQRYRNEFFKASKRLHTRESTEERDTKNRLNIYNI